MLDWKTYLAQPQEFREALMPSFVDHISIEAGLTLGWERILGDSPVPPLMIGIDSFGASAPAPALYQHFGLTPEAISGRVRAELERRG